MIGPLLSLLSAIAFAYAGASVRRGVLTGTVMQALAISLAVALALFLPVMLVSDGFRSLINFSMQNLGLLAVAGIIHFAGGRYCNFRATKAIGANMVATIQQFSLVVTLVLAVIWLGEQLAFLRFVGIGLVILGSALTLKLPRSSKRPAALSADARSHHATLDLHYAEGYFFAFLSAVGFGISPILISMALIHKGVSAGVAGVFVSYAAATAAVGLILLAPGQRKSFKSLDAVSARWFFYSAVAVGLSQLLRFMALALAPVSVVSPIQRLSIVFRIYLSWLINPNHEVFDRRVIWGTVLSLIGGLALTVSMDSFIESLSLPAQFIGILAWHWP